jgi:hypothetical protein
VINGGARFTNGTKVQMEISAQDPVPGSGISNMSLSDDGSIWDPWLAYSGSCRRNLTAGDGIKSIQVRLRDRAGNVGPASAATIILDTTPPVSHIQVLNMHHEDVAFDVNWSAEDAGSGVASFDIQYQDNEGPWKDWLTATCQTGARFTGQDTHSYRFRVLARDNVWNEEADFTAVSNPTKVELPPPALSISRPSAGSHVRGKCMVTGESSHPRPDKNVIQVEVRIDQEDWMPAGGTLNWTYALDSARLKNGEHTISARAYDGVRYSAVSQRDIVVDNDKGLTSETVPLLTLFLVVVLAASAIVGGMFIVRRRKDDRQSHAPVGQLRPPAVPYAPGPPPQPYTPHGQAGPGISAPARPLVIEGVVSAREFEREPVETPGETGVLPAVPAPVAPGAAPRPRTAQEEESRREGLILRALTSLPRGLPSTLWGIELEELASRIVKAERRDTPEGDLLVKIDNRWFYGDETNLGMFMQEYRNR